MSTVNHFERLGLPRRFSLSPADVEREYLARSRDVHPDYHQLGTAGEERASTEMSALLNEAYATLRDPFRRAEYLLLLEGGPSASESKEMAPAFLEEILELRMRIEEARESGAGSADAAGLQQELAARRGALLGEVAKVFAGYESAPIGERPGQLVRVRQLLNASKYVQGLLRDLRAD
jgi:molecular chaperone HscB